MYHAGMVAPKFAVTEIDGLGLVIPTIRVRFEKILEMTDACGKIHLT